MENVIQIFSKYSQKLFSTYLYFLISKQPTFVSKYLQANTSKIYTVCCVGTVGTGFVFYLISY